jgi:hypothetical protein
MSLGLVVVISGGRESAETFGVKQHKVGIWRKRAEGGGQRQDGEGLCVPGGCEMIVQSAYSGRRTSCRQIRAHRVRPRASPHGQDTRVDGARGSVD